MCFAKSFATTPLWHSVETRLWKGSSTYYQPTHNGTKLHLLNSTALMADVVSISRSGAPLQLSSLSSTQLSNCGQTNQHVSNTVRHTSVHTNRRTCTNTSHTHTMQTQVCTQHTQAHTHTHTHTHTSRNELCHIRVTTLLQVIIHIRLKSKEMPHCIKKNSANYYPYVIATES